jgi:Xaa-Pro aminopeptidase
MADNTNDAAKLKTEQEQAKAKADADAAKLKAEADAKAAEAKKAADDAAELKAFREKEAETRLTAQRQAEIEAVRAAKAIDEDTIDALVEDARLAGANEKSLSELRGALASSTVDELPKFNEQISALRKKNRKPHHVVSQGSVMFNGDRYEHEDPILLTDSEALDLGPEVVAPGTAPPKPRDINKRKGGKYTVAGPGSVYKDGRHRHAGEVLELNEDDARSLGEAVVEV